MTGPARLRPEQVAPLACAPDRDIASAVLFAEDGRYLLQLRDNIPGLHLPGHWGLFGGSLEPGEDPEHALRREVSEEVGLRVERGRLVAVDFLRPKPGKPGGLRFLFDCGAFPDTALDGIRLQIEELSEHLLVEPARALELLSGPLRRRVGAALALEGPGCVYLEDGRPV